MNYAEAIDYLYQLRLFGTKLGLDQTRQLAALAGNPHHRLRFIHVAGTNGKGSVCAMLESVYRHAGFKTGLFTSPHLVSFTERMQVNRIPIAEVDVARWTTQLRQWLETFPSHEHPTFFEVVTVMALLHFAEQGCDIVLWETGMGGRLDATNIVTPLASVITNVDLDHQPWLGASVEAITREKAGIIKPGVPVITGIRQPECLAIVRKFAHTTQSPLQSIHDPQGREAFASILATMQLSLHGRHQRENAAIALLTVHTMQPILPVDESASRQGLEATEWAGRCQRVVRPGGGILLLDGAHNASGSEVLAQTLRTDFPNRKPALLLGMLADKDCEAICRSLGALASRVCLAPVQSMRSAQPVHLVKTLRNHYPDLPIACHENLREAWAALENESFILACGSIYLVGELMELLLLSPFGTRQERSLNEWGLPPNP